MHFLLIPFLCLNLIFMVICSLPQNLQSRQILAFVSCVALMIIFSIMSLRPATGDGFRYYQHFLELNGASFTFLITKMFESDPIYIFLNWIFGWFGTQPFWLFGSCAGLYIVFFVLSVRLMTSKPVETAIVVMLYSVYPYFITYSVNAIRQGLSLTFLMFAYANFRRQNSVGWIWLFLAPFWHSGSWLAVGVVIAHQLMCKYIATPRLRWQLVLLGFFVSIGLSVTAVNDTVGAIFHSQIAVDSSHEIYFEDNDDVDYRTGFRADFFLFSILPLVSAFILRRQSPTFSYQGSGWLLSLYLSLNIIYNLFSFAPFSDRFAIFSWYLVPLLLFMQVNEMENRRFMLIFVSVFLSIDLVLLQTFTGKYISLPVGI